MAESNYKHGEMDITAQEKTFHGFMKMTVRIGLVCIAVVVFLAVYAR